MRLRNINLEDDDLDSLFLPHKEQKVKRMKNPQPRTKSERTNKIFKGEE
jgi:hypothetical protein